MLARKENDEIVFVGTDGIERKAFIARLHSESENDEYPKIDVAMPLTPPDVAASEFKSEKAAEKAEENLPAPLLNQGETANVLHESKRLLKHAYWKDTPANAEAWKAAAEFQEKQDKAARIPEEVVAASVARLARATSTATGLR